MCAPGCHINKIMTRVVTSLALFQNAITMVWIVSKKRRKWFWKNVHQGVLGNGSMTHIVMTHAIYNSAITMVKIAPKKKKNGLKRRSFARSDVRFTG